MASDESSRDNGVRTDSEDEPTDLVMNIKEEPKEDDEYYEDCFNNGISTDDHSEDMQHQDGDMYDESASEYYKEISIPQVSPLPDGGELKPLKVVRVVSSDPPREPSPPPTLTSRRLVPISIKTSGPIPIALSLSKPEVDPKTNASVINSQSSAHHLMTLATEADKILKKQENRLKSEKGSGSDLTDEGKISEEDNMGSSSDSSSGVVDSFLGSGDQTMTLIQRRAAEASLSSSKKSKRKRSQLPDDLKDETYWERRRKNNEAAKRSRDARRAKEDQIAIRAALLEQENMRLRIEVGALKEETIRLKGLLYEKR